MFKSTNQIKDSFIKDGWNKSIQFEEVTITEAEQIGVVSIVEKIKNGRKYYRMLFSGNIYDDNGSITLYNVKCK